MFIVPNMYGHAFFCVSTVEFLLEILYSNFYFLIIYVITYVNARTYFIIIIIIIIIFNYIVPKM